LRQIQLQVPTQAAFAVRIDEKGSPLFLNLPTAQIKTAVNGPQYYHMDGEDSNGFFFQWCALGI
jgi:hypothetical protein